MDSNIAQISSQPESVHTFFAQPEQTFRGQVGTLRNCKTLADRLQAIRSSNIPVSGTTHVLMNSVHDMGQITKVELLQSKAPSAGTNEEIVNTRFRQGPVFHREPESKKNQYETEIKSSLQVRLEKLQRKSKYPTNDEELVTEASEIEKQIIDNRSLQCSQAVERKSTLQMRLDRLQRKVKYPLNDKKMVKEPDETEDQIVDNRPRQGNMLYLESVAIKSEIEKRSSLQMRLERLQGKVQMNNKEPVTEQQIVDNGLLHGCMVHLEPKAKKNQMETMAETGEGSMFHVKNKSNLQLRLEKLQRKTLHSQNGIESSTIHEMEQLERNSKRSSSDNRTIVEASQAKERGWNHWY